ncbi:hypothetical protein BSKO_00726 [Bryopsis sp. KO-2023]|nr:hypothetical protein BSKO_00726 [Bryopsis sp. KO-2023]
MYNGIGLLTPRGSGTSGYVQANKFNLRRPPPAFEEGNRRKAEDGPKEKKPNLEIILHNKKREIEVKLYELQMTLEDEGVPEEQVEAQVAAERTRLERDLLEHESAPTSIQEKGAQETHETARRKMEQMDRLKNALGLGDVKEGEAFDQELQEKRRQERVAEREAMEKERKKRLKEEKRKDEDEEKRRRGSQREGRRSEKRHKRGDNERSRARSRSRSRSRSREGNQEKRSRDRDERKSDREDGRQVNHHSDRKHIAEDSRAPPNPPEPARPPQLPRDDVDAAWRSSTPEVAEGPSCDDQVGEGKNVEVDPNPMSHQESLDPANPQRRQSQGWDAKRRDTSGFPMEGRLAGRLQMPADRRRDNWRPGSESRGRGRGGNLNHGGGRGDRDQWNSRWNDRGRGQRGGRGRGWQPRNWSGQHEGGGFYRKGEEAPERYNPGCDLPDDVTFIDTRPPNWDNEGRWPKSRGELDGENKEPVGEKDCKVVLTVEQPASQNVLEKKIDATGKNATKASLSPSPHSLMSIKRSPSLPRQRRKPGDYRSECPSPTSDDLSDVGDNRENSLTCPLVKENGAQSDAPAGVNGCSKDVDPQGDAPKHSASSEVQPVMETKRKSPSEKGTEDPKTCVLSSDPLLAPSMSDPPRGQVNDETAQKRVKRSSSQKECPDSHKSVPPDEAGKRSGDPRSNRSRTRSKSRSLAKSRSRSVSLSKSRSRSRSVSRSSMSRSRSKSRAKSRSRSVSGRSRSGSSSRSSRSDSSQSRGRPARRNREDRRHRRDGGDRRVRDHRPTRDQRGRHLGGRSRYDSRYRPSGPAPGRMRTGDMRRFGGGGRFRGYNGGGRLGGSRFHRERQGWGRPGDRRVVARGDRDRGDRRRSRSRDRGRARRSSPDRPSRRRRSPSKSRSSSRGRSPRAKRTRNRSPSISSRSRSPAKRSSFSPRRAGSRGVSR